MEGGDRLRLFVALPLPEETAERVLAWQRDVLGAASGARLIRRENLHVTVAFLGSRRATDAEPILEALRTAAARGARPALAPSGYRETLRVGMLVLADEDGRAARLAADVGERLERLGVYERERRPWLPHVTVLRFHERPRLAPPLPDLARFSPSELALYHSVLRRSGAQYEIRESVALGG
ncbi:MAG: RNA 2',3'-cyclic phosphodiesterase [Actinomycetota bacterium]|nr:RNA 2',3'-cyclic phosphodiesterase [Actinomycetota bacterium]